MRGAKTKCPICKKEMTGDKNLFKPFCSERCRLIDLGKWASGDYRIAGEKKELHDEVSSEKNKIEK